MNFPLYRRYKNGQSYFKILSQSEFIEYKLNIKQLEEHYFETKILPDRNYLQDMIHDYELYWDAIDEDTFNEFLNKHKS